ncbi:MAG: FeoA domain-containing protein [Caldilineaceae bacterium]|nr:FeoA domain-containing protein [Caldilineaceae bacterium]
MEGNLLLLFIVLAGVAVIFLWLRPGAARRWARLRRARSRAQAEDALKHLHACEWRKDCATPTSLAGTLGISLKDATSLIARLEAQGWLTSTEGGLRLTPEGEQLALNVIRAHRLWERYLADEARMPLTAIHDEAERREHARTDWELDALDAALGHPQTDPHGDPIPTAEGMLEHRGSHPLTDWPLNTPARIVHLEDEPPAVYSQLVAEGFHLGQVVRIIHASPQRLVLSDGDEGHTLAPAIAANIFVVAEAPARPEPAMPTLASLRVGQRATVRNLDGSLQGFTRRRLLDLGLTPGTTVTVAMRSFIGDPVAYRVRGSLVALRREQAAKVFVEDVLEGEGI